MNKPLKGRKPVDIIDRRPGRCAAIVKSEGRRHWCCGAKVTHDNPRWRDWCEDHLPVVPLEIEAEKYARVIQRRFARHG